MIFKILFKIDKFIWPYDYWTALMGENPSKKVEIRIRKGEFDMEYKFMNVWRKVNKGTTIQNLKMK